MRFIKNNYLLLIIILISAFLRLYHIGFRDFWYDEAVTGVEIRESWAHMMDIIQADVHPPLYFFLVKVWSMFGNYSVIAIRSFSAFWGILGVVGVYLFTKEVAHKRAGLFASLIIAISPFAIQYSQEARMYAMHAALIVFAAYFVVRAAKHLRVQDHIVWGIFLGLAILTHYMGIAYFLIFPIMYFVGIFVYHGKQFVFQKFWYLAKHALLGVSISLAVCIPFIRVFMNQISMSSTSIGWIPSAYVHDIGLAFQAFIVGTAPGQISVPHVQHIWGIDDRIVLVFCVICVVVIFGVLIRKYKFKSILLLLPCLGFILIVFVGSLLGHSFFISRYLISASYFLYAIFGVWITTYSKIKMPYAIVAVYTILLLSIVPSEQPHGFNDLDKETRYNVNDFYTLNPVDYVVAKYYFGFDRVYLYSVDNPTFNPVSWVGVNGTIKRIEKIDDIINNGRAMILSNTDHPTSFDENKFVRRGQYDNIIIFET